MLLSPVLSAKSNYRERVGKDKSVRIQQGYMHKSPNRQQFEHMMQLVGKVSKIDFLTTHVQIRKVNSERNL